MPLICDDVALEIQAHINGLPAFHGFATPDALIVLLQITDIGVATRFDAGLGLAFSKAVGAGHWCSRIVALAAVDRVVVWTIVGRGLLRQCGACRKSDSGRYH